MNEIRLSHAKRLLAADDHSIAEVGYACGFASPSVFSRAFRASVGLSPQEFRDHAVGLKLTPPRNDR